MVSALSWRSGLEMLMVVMFLLCRTADAYKVGSTLSDDGVLASDHRPVFADVTI